MLNPSHTMEQLIQVVRRLRVEEHFHGYIHLKAIPGASPELIRQAGLYTDRLSVNIELPTEQSLLRLAPQKNKQAILQPMSQIAAGIAENRAERKQIKRAPLFVPAGQSTQLIVGASPEDDRQIIRLAASLYGHYQLKRVYYSAFVPVNEDARLLPTEKPDLLREHRLYQADWLVRRYGFHHDELLPAHAGFLERELDPKTAWALRNMQHFPLNVQTAEYEWLLRVPGIGFTSAARIVSSRRFAALRLEDLPRLGVVMKRAQYFIVCEPHRLPPALSADEIRRRLLRTRPADETWVQPELFAV
jgi:putative DNA modification/repair radical SAM protein